MFQHSNINELVYVAELQNKLNWKFYYQYVRSHLEKVVVSYFKCYNNSNVLYVRNA